MPRITDPAVLAAQRATHETLRNMVLPPTTIRASALDFARSLIQSFNAYGGSWTERQHAAAQRLIAEANAAAQRAVMGAVAEVAADAAALPQAVTLAPAANAAPGLDRIVALFATARQSGLRSPRLAIRDGVQLSAGRADPTSINVRQNGAFAGTIRGGIFQPARFTTPSQSLTTRLAALAADPTGELTAYGFASGRCGCCTRPLSDPISVAMGIGPICAARFGISRAGVTPAATSITLAAGQPTPTVAAPVVARPARPARARYATIPSPNAPIGGHVFADDEIVR
jgi:hypothetical protein